MYNDKAFAILNASINSAIFIDERAKDFYSNTPTDANVVEEKLSEDLFKTFKQHGKSLAVHKFATSDLENPKILEYLFKGRDLILLDWELAEMEGQKHSLKLLNEAVTAPYINFCCIYSSAGNFTEIPFFLDAYFSGLNMDEFELIKNSYGHIEPEEIKKLWDSGTHIKIFFEENSIETDEVPVEKLRQLPPELILKYIYISLTLEKFIIPETAINPYEISNVGDNSFIINNTFVLTLKKEPATDSNCNELLQRIANVVIKNTGSFFQLLGLEMQSVFNSNEKFIDETILKSSAEALFKFRAHINDDKVFGIIIKKLLIEQATLKLRTAKLELLKTDFLDSMSKELATKVPSDEDLFHLNVFYNAVSVKSLNSDDIPSLNFGDVFKGQNDEYYLCITALCDCYYPDKIESNFYFVKGKEFADLDTALRLGDTAFLNFLPNNKVVQWGHVESVNKKKLKKMDGELDEAFKIRKLEQEIISYKAFLYKPFYIKPKVYNVANSKLIENKIQIWDITNKVKDEHPNQSLNSLEIEYITTLRSDYTQRIANHAFGHPLRVGIDFVKKT